MKYKLVLIVFLMCLINSKSNAQLGIGTNAPNASAVLDVATTNKGLLIPRMTNAQKNAISNPATGLTVYCTDCEAAGLLNIFNGTNWVNLNGNISNYPSITTTAISSITTTSASSGGNLTSIGTSNVTARGVCWNTSPNPTTANSKVNISGTITSAGSFTSSLTGLTATTTYYVRAYATNGSGTSYGEEFSFTTATPVPLAGSYSFNGTNQYLSLTTGLTFGTGAFTVEGWIYNTGTLNADGIIGYPTDAPAPANTGALFLGFFDNKQVTTTVNNSNAQNTYTYLFTNAITANAWHYFIYNKNASGLAAVFIDGVKSTNTIQDNNNYFGPSTWIGRNYWDGYWPGYITNLRVTIGAAIYDSNALTGTIPNPTSPLTSSGNTKLLLLGTSPISDAAGVQTITNNGTVTISTLKPY